MLDAVRVLRTRYNMQVFNGQSQADSSQLSLPHDITINNKLRYREQHSASVVLSWCTL